MINQDLERRIEAYRGNPQALMQRYQQSQQLIDLLALQRIKSEKEAAARQIQMQMGQQPTVAEQREAEVMDLTRQEVAQRVGEVGQQKQQQQQQAMQKMMGGLAAAPGAQAMMPTQAMAAGGIVAFQEGGEMPEVTQPSDERELSDEERERRRDLEIDETRRLMRRYPRPEPRSMAERAQRQMEEKGSIYSPTYGMTPTEREAARKPTGLAQILEQRRLEEERMAPPREDAMARYLRQTPSVSERYPEERLERGALPPAPVERMQPQGVPQTMPQPAQAAAPSAAPPRLDRTQVPTVPAVDQGGRTGMEGISQVGDPKLREALARMMDPQRAEQERIRAQAAAKAAYDLTPEERARYDRHMAELEQLDKQRFSPEALRRRRWEDFAAGAVNKESMAGALGGGAASAVRGGRTMEEAQREALLQRQKQAEAMLERQRGIRKGVFEASEKAGEEATKGLPAALQTAGSLETAALKSSDEAKNRAAALERLGIERASAEKIALLNAESQAEIAKATREGTLLNKQAQLLDGINRREDLAIQELRTKNPAYNALLAKQKNGMLLPDELKQLQTMESGFAREEKAIRELFNARRDAVSMAGFRVLKD